MPHNDFLAVMLKARFARSAINAISDGVEPKIENHRWASKLGAEDKQTWSIIQGYISAYSIN